jgi:arylsulfatase
VTSGFCCRPFLRRCQVAGIGIPAATALGQQPPQPFHIILVRPNQRDYLEGRSENSARDYFYYFSGATPSAVRFKNWKMYYTMTKSNAAGWLEPLTKYHWTVIQNIKRDPFEQCVTLEDSKSAFHLGGALASPSTAYIYDWNILPIGQKLWYKHLMTYKEFPPLQDPESYNLDGILKMVQDAARDHPSD